MKKLLAAVAIAALGTTASAQTLTPQPEVTQSAPSFAGGAGFGSLGSYEGIVVGVLLLVIIGAMASGDNDKSSTTVFD